MSKQQNKFLDVALPYVLKRYCEGYVILNRAYKPLGFPLRQHAAYSDQPILMSIPGLNKHQAKRLSCKWSVNVDTISLYDDRTHPFHSAANMADYLKRLQILGSLEVSPMDWPEGAEKLIRAADDLAFENREALRVLEHPIAVQF